MADTEYLAEIRHALSYQPRVCDGSVIRDGDEDACNKPAVALIDARELEDGSIWTACAYHANRYGRGRCVPLDDILAAIKEATDA